MSKVKQRHPLYGPCLVETRLKQHQTKRTTSGSMGGTQHGKSGTWRTWFDILNEVWDPMKTKESSSRKPTQEQTDEDHEHMTNIPPYPKLNQNTKTTHPQHPPHGPEEILPLGLNTYPIYTLKLLPNNFNAIDLTHFPICTFPEPIYRNQPSMSYHLRSS